MPNSPERLQQTLDLLHQQLEETDLVDAATADRLRRTIGEIEVALQQRGQQAGELSLSQRLSEAAAHFEESHPTIAGTLTRLVDILGQMGI